MTLSVKLQPLPANKNINLGVHIPLVFTSCINTGIPQKEPCSCELLWRKAGYRSISMISQSGQSTSASYYTGMDPEMLNPGFGDTVANFIFI